jgi:Mg-chelatase subunit ChlD
MKKGCACCLALPVLIIGLLIMIGMLVPSEFEHLLTAEQKTRSEQIKSMLAEMKYVEPTGAGNAILLLFDASGSMKEPVPIDITKTPKIDIAKQAAKRIFAAVAEPRPNQVPSILLGLNTFHDDRVQVMVPLSPPPHTNYGQAIDGIVPDGNTPLGEAIITAYRALQCLSTQRQHIIVITDGENTAGRDPVDAVKVMRRLSGGRGPQVYFIAFDVAASAFDDEKNAGVWVAEARDAKELNQTLDFIFYKKIMAESIQ